MTRTLLRSLMLAAGVTTAANAQLGGLIKKAIANKTEKTSDKNGSALAGDPVDASTLSSLLRGLAIESQSRTAIAQLQATRDAKNSAREQLATANDKAIRTYEAGNESSRACIGAAMDAASTADQAELKKKALAMVSDPAAMQRYQQASMEFSRSYAKLLAANDSIGARKALVAYYRSMGIDIMADSNAAFAKCGKPPAKPDAMVQIASLSASVDSLNAEIQRREQQATVQSMSASGMPADKYGLARERLFVWYRSRQSGDKKVTKDEDALFSSHASEIERVANVLK